MRPGEPSRTAQWVAFARGLGHHEVPSIHEDRVARALLGPPWSTMLAAADVDPPLARVMVGAGDRLSGGRTRFMSYRTRVLDDVVREGAAAGIRQVVLLGAGLDARAWRLGDALADAVVFEVDHPDTQAFKRERLAGLPSVAREVRFVGVDFEKDALDAKLLAAGFDARLPATVLWEGVVMYLPSEAIDATLRILRGLLAAGSLLAISYSRSGSGRIELLRRSVAVVVAAAGEQFRHHEEPPAMRARVERAGFRWRWDEGHPDWAPRLTGRRTTWDIQRVVLVGG